MSGACFPTGTEAALTSMNCGKDLMEPNHGKQTDKLLEYEHMVSSAENKCTLLKGQLEKIKQLYANQTELVKQATSANSGGDRATARTLPEAPPNQSARLVRQTSHAIGTEDTAASYGTINNILTGITKSIQMTDFLDQLKDLNEKTTHKSSRLDDDGGSVRGVEGVKISTRSKQSLTVRSRSKMKGKSSRTKVTPKVSSAIMKKIKIPPVKLPEKKVRTSETALGRPHNFLKENKKMSRVVSRKPRGPSSRLNMSSQPEIQKNNSDLVEIYHNIAVKESRSSESDVPKKQHAAARKDEEIHEVEVHVVPPLNIHDADQRTMGAKSMTSAVSRNYELPTISWKMKNVAKYYMNSFNIKTIPFVPATSIGPSHNIGINIQQVMSMVKTKQPVQKLSPTLAYNIGLAAGRWENHPLSFLSSLASKVYSQCPLSKSPSMQYHQLQEVAKTIPQEIIEEDEEEDEDEQNSPDTQSIIITGPSGDVRVTNRKQTVWTMEASDEKKCTCVPEKGIEFQQIINKFNGSVSKSRMTKPQTHLRLTKPPVPKHPAPKNAGNNAYQEVRNVATNEMIPLQNKENKLKEVLAKLHDDFDAMTKTYDELSKKAEDDKTNTDLIKKLESLDKDLNSKEEEIVMVMTLYKEVLALKQQVKTLKERTTSKENVSLKPHHQMRITPSQFNSGGNSTAAGLLSKLLKQIQHFQTHYKRN